MGRKACQIARSQKKKLRTEVKERSLWRRGDQQFMPKVGGRGKVPVTGDGKTRHIRDPTEKQPTLKNLVVYEGEGNNGRGQILLQGTVIKEGVLTDAPKEKEGPMDASLFYAREKLSFERADWKALRGAKKRGGREEVSSGSGGSCKPTHD